MAGDGRTQSVDNRSEVSRPSALKNRETPQGLRETAQTANESPAFKAAVTRETEERKRRDVISADQAKAIIAEELQRFDSQNNARRSINQGEETLRKNSPLVAPEATSIDNAQLRSRHMTNLGQHTYDKLTAMDRGVYAGHSMPQEVRGYADALKKAEGMEKSWLHKMLPGRTKRLTTARAEAERQFDHMLGMLGVPAGGAETARDMIGKMINTYDQSADARKHQARMEADIPKKQKEYTKLVLDVIKHPEQQAGGLVAPELAQNLDAYLSRKTKNEQTFPEMPGQVENMTVAQRKAHEEEKYLHGQLLKQFGKPGLEKILAAKKSSSNKQKAA